MWTETRSEIHQSPTQGYRCVVEGLWRGFVRGVDPGADGEMARQVASETYSGTLPLTSFDGRVSLRVRLCRFAARRGGTRRIGVEGLRLCELSPRSDQHPPQKGKHQYVERAVASM